jgi:hypothetical protein
MPSQSHPALCTLSERHQAPFWHYKCLDERLMCCDIKPTALALVAERQKMFGHVAEDDSGYKAGTQMGRKAKYQL